MADILYEDLHSHILSYIHESETLCTISRSVPSSHPLFTLVLRRLCQLPWPLSCQELGHVEDVNRLLDLLILSAEPSTQPFPIVDAIRHLVIETTPVIWSSPKESSQWLRKRLVELFRLTNNLQVLDWCGEFGPSKEEIYALQGIDRLKMLHVDCGASAKASWEEERWEE